VSRTFLVATDSDHVFTQVDAAVGGTADIARVTAGQDVRPAVKELEPDLVVADMQIGSMGGVATCLDLRLEEGAGRLPESRILLLLDRPADTFLAERSGADGWLIKPIDPQRLRRAVRTLLAGGAFTESAALA